MQKRIMAIVITSGGFILIIIAKLVFSSLPYPFLTWGLGFLMVFAGSVLLKKNKGINEEKSTVTAITELEDLMATGFKITVDLEECEIKENNYQEEITGNYNSGSDIAGFALLMDTTDWESITYYGDATVQVTVNQTILIYNTTVAGKPARFISPVLPFERETLMFKLFAQKQTIIYVSRTSNKYYFDVQFLFQ